MRCSRARGALAYPSCGVPGEHLSCVAFPVAPVPLVGDPILLSVRITSVCRHVPLGVMSMVAPGQPLAPEREGGITAV